MRDGVCGIMFGVLYTHTELPSLLPVVQLSEALLRLEKGPHLLTRLIANMPDTFDQGTCTCAGSH